MSIVAHAVVHGAGHSAHAGLHNLHNIRGVGWLSKGFSGLISAGTLGMGFAMGYSSYGHDYGMGVAGLYAIASHFPITAIPLGIIEMCVVPFGNMAYERQQYNRKSSFVKSGIDDRFGTINAMRQYSIQQLSRDHTSKQRVLGNEAFYLHR